MSALPKRYFTPEEYLELECKADYKSQYVAGEIYAMSGAQSPHVSIESNLIAALHNAFRGKSCRVFTSNMRVRAGRGEMYTYPDASALCGKPMFDHSSKPESLLNPQVVFEVLSASTEAFDRGDKFARYRRIESLEDYVLVSSEQRRVEHYVRQANGAWTMTEYNQAEHQVPLGSVGCELPLAEIYLQVELPNEREA